MVQENNPEETSSDRQSRESEADKLFQSHPSLELQPKRTTPNSSGITTGGDGESADGGHGDISDIMEHSHKKSDIQTVIEKLFPDFPEDWLNKVLVSRVFPDAYNHLLMMGVKELVSTNPKMTVVQATMYMNSVLSMAIDGESRIDAIHIVGRGAEMEETKAKNNMGIP